MPQPALSGVRVLDLTRLLAGAYLTVQLADHGADVLKVEHPGGGDGLRSTPPRTSTGEGAAHLALNRGKRSAALNLRDPGDRETLLSLVESADVLVESFRAGVMDRLGLGWEVLRERRRSLVMVSVTAYGPGSTQIAHDLNAQADSGALLLAGGGAPSLPGSQYADLSAALHAVVGTLAALRHAEATGEGQRVEVSMADAALSLLPMATAVVSATGVAPEPGGDALTGALACYGLYECADGRWLAVAPLEPKFFGPLAGLLGEPELAQWQYDPGRQDELRARLASVFASRDRGEWLELLSEHDTCVSPVRDVAEALAAARERGSVVDVPFPAGGVFAQVMPPARLSVTPARVGPAPPRLDADGSVWRADDRVVGGAP